MANQGAKLISVGVLADFKNAVIKFGEQAKIGLIEANSEIHRTISRLQTDVLAHWTREEKLWTRKVAEAKSELYRAQLQSRDERPSVVIERKALDAAQRRLEIAQQKIQRIRYWKSMIAKEAMLCRGQLQQLDRVIDGELPRVTARLDRLMQDIEKYLKTRAPEAPIEGDAKVEEATRGAKAAPPVEEAPTVRADEDIDCEGGGGTKEDEDA